MVLIIKGIGFCYALMGRLLLLSVIEVGFRCCGLVLGCFDYQIVVLVNYQWVLV